MGEKGKKTSEWINAKNLLGLWENQGKKPKYIIDEKTS